MHALVEMTESSSEMVNFCVEEKVCVEEHHGLLGSKRRTEFCSSSVLITL